MKNILQKKGMKKVAEVSGRENTIEKNKAVMRKKRRKTKMKKRFIVFVFLFLCAGIILTVLKAPFFNISGIDCVGQERLTREQLLDSAQIKVGSNILKRLNAELRLYLRFPNPM